MSMHEELHTISNQLIAKHGRDLMELVSMWSFFAELARPLGMIGELNNLALTRLVIDKCAAIGKTSEQLHDAVVDSERASATVKYLLTLPE